MTVEESYSFCRRLTLSHYENFPVASFLVHPNIRRHIFAIYAFARTADDIADESTDKSKAMEQLYLLKSLLENREDESEQLFPFMPALMDTVKRTQLPVQFLINLLNAFIYDINHQYFESWDDLYNYCKHSAQPVGHIILWLHKLYREPFISQSDAITTALQMANFWQDISIDRHKNRLYIPLEFLVYYQVSANELFNDHKSAVRQEIIQDLVNKTKKLMFKGKGIWNGMPIRLRYELRLTFYGGMRILQKIEKMGEKVFFNRPVLNKTDWLINIFRLI